LQCVVTDVISNYETRFPGDNYIHGFKAPDGSSVSDLREIISTIEARKRQHEYVFKTYHEKILPLGWVATTLKMDIPEVMAHLSFLEDKGSAIIVEWPDSDNQKASCQLAQSAPQLVLTRSALESARRLELLEVVRANYELIAPRMLLNVLAQEAHEAGEHAKHGKKAISGQDGRLEVREIEPGHPALVEQAQKAEELLAWCREHVKARPRPLQFLEPKADAQQVRDMIGEDSWDCLEVALDEKVLLWTDDLGLRRVDIAGDRPPGVSTIAILMTLKDKGVLGEVDHSKHLHTLIRQRYYAILPTRDILVSGVLRYPELDRSDVSRILGTLALLPKVAIASTLFAEVLRSIATADVQRLSIESVPLLGLEGLGTRWPRALAARQLYNDAGRSLSLLPLPLRAVQRACVEFGQGRPYSVD